MKSLVVQKYGGTSVADLKCVSHVADLIRESHESGKKIDFKDLVKAVENHWGKKNTITSFQRKSWPTLNSYTHNGKAMLLDHWNNGTMEPKFPEDQIDQIIHLSARCDWVSLNPVSL